MSGQEIYGTRHATWCLKVVDFLGFIFLCFKKSVLVIAINLLLKKFLSIQKIYNIMYKDQQEEN